MFKTKIKGYELIFETNEDVFSPAAADKGTLAMLSSITFHMDDKLLDLGCGYGVVGLTASNFLLPQNIVMCDISENAVMLSNRNAELNKIFGIHILQSDGFSNVKDSDFTLILSNPPYHTDFTVAKHFIENSYKRLVIGGRLVMVTKRLSWYKNKLTSVFGGVIVSEIDGYYVFNSVKKAGCNQRKVKEKGNMSKKLKRKYHRSIT